MPSNDSIRALIDIGTNSVKLLVVEAQGETLIPVREESDQTRLGRGFYETHELQAEAIQDTALAVARFCSIAKEYGAPTLRVIATSAARDARNQQELLDTVRRVAKVNIEVITGDQEAEWVYRGVTSDALFRGKHLLILDVGGGSTEFILGEGDHRRFRDSFPIGSVRLLENLRPPDPPRPEDLLQCQQTISQFLEEKVVPELRREMTAKGGGFELVGTGGASTIMGRIVLRLESFERDRLEGASLSLPEVQALVKRLWNVPLQERKRIVGLPKKRADVILTGACIYEGVMKHLGFQTLRMSTRGLRFGGLMDAAGTPTPLTPTTVR